MEINNFDLITNHLHFNSDDDFYFLQIIQRKKDGHNVSNNYRLLKYYLIRSTEHLDRYKSEIMELCKMFNARAYIHPTKRSFKEVGKLYTKNVLSTFMEESYNSLHKKYSSACGQSYIASDKKFIIDIDYNAEDVINGETFELWYQGFIWYLCEECKCKIEYVVPTIKGRHLIVEPFDLKKFSDMNPDIDVHKNNPTLLYYKK